MEASSPKASLSGKKPCPNKETEQLQLIADSIHDLRTPVSAINIAAQALQHHVTEADASRLLQGIIKTSNHLAKIINNTLQTNKSLNNALTLRSFLVYELLNELKETLSLSAEMANLTLTIDCPSDLFIVSDRNCCYRLLFNLIENAIKYTEEGNIIIRAVVQSSTITFEVQDTGVGIIKEKQNLIFNQFIQVNDSQDGTGLGLYLVKLLANQLHGTLSLDSKEGIGTTFSFKFSPKKHVV
jgi:signal transduction histidine kinase